MSEQSGIKKTETNKAYVLGHISAFAGYLIWGILPLYWKMLTHVDPFEIFSYRIIFAVVTFLLISLMYKRQEVLKLIKDPKMMKSIAGSAFLIGLNWCIYVYAVNTGNVVSASLGYYINPLVSVFLGVIILKEKLTVPQIIAVILALFGVVYLSISHGALPWISLVLAFSFGIYGLFKKRQNLNSIDSLFLETLLLSPLVAAYLIFTILRGSNSFFATPLTTVLIILSGIVTIIPLFLFSEGAKRIPLSSVGFLQYFAPTIMLCLGVFLFGESFSQNHLVAFGSIWIALCIYTVSLIRRKRRVDNI